ncbi:MAG TPA: glutamine-hydrolyzing GMP synthase, partial [Thermoanaerobaculia bacterium]|nr:glutamine-hydrolyzing GMP synthase [Thermoanaerobaculia bacterium]
METLDSRSHPSSAPGTGHQTVLVLDFGSQFTQLIARRVRENRVYCEVHPFDLSLDEIRRRQPIGLILSGGPQSVYEAGAPHADPALFGLGIPVFGICYGMQLLAHLLGGSVEGSSHREYGRAEIRVTDPGTIFAGLAPVQTVWMSHGDRVRQPPPGCRVTASTDNAPIVGFEDSERGLYAIQFHPEVSHTVSGPEILHNFLYGACHARGDWGMASYLEEAVATVRERVGEGRVLCALSGGVDSSVVAALLKRAVGERSTAVFVDTGLLRKDEGAQVVHSLQDGLGIPILRVNAGERFLSELSRTEDPEKKRKTIGRLFIKVFAEEARRLAADVGG